MSLIHISTYIENHGLIDLYSEISNYIFHKLHLKYSIQKHPKYLTVDDVL